MTKMKTNIDEKASLPKSAEWQPKRKATMNHNDKHLAMGWRIPKLNIYLKSPLAW